MVYFRKDLGSGLEFLCFVWVFFERRLLEFFNGYNPEGVSALLCSGNSLNQIESKPFYIVFLSPA